jgi:hypothetical protein
MTATTSRWAVRRQGLWLTLVGLYVLITPWLTTRAVKRATWDTEPSGDRYGLHPTIRGDLQPRDAWRGTPDERLPGGTYEPTVREWLAEHGRDECAKRWLLRNRAHGIRAAYAIPSTEAAWLEQFPEVGRVTRGVRSDGTWFYKRRVGAFCYVEGHRIYQYLDGTYQAIPTCTIKRA